MTLLELIIWLTIGFTGYQFWRIRAISEAANRYLNLYCEKQGLQLISVARDKTRFGLVRGKPDWKTQFVFEFSGNGEDKYQGLLEMEGHRAVATTVPPYRMN